MEPGGIATLPGGLYHVVNCAEVGLTKRDGELLDQRTNVRRASSFAAVHFVDPI
jgi:hypothetical protein